METTDPLLMNPQGPSASRPSRERPGGLGDVHLGGVARTIVVDGFEAKDDAKARTRLSARRWAGNHFEGDRLAVGPAAG